MKIDKYSDSITTESFKLRMTEIGLHPHQNLLLACSGGSDSMCLAHLLIKTNYKFSIAHVNYGLRGKESDEDMQFVINYCREYNLNYYILNAKQNLKQGNIQEQARTIRYKWLNELALKHKFDAILTAHHMNDQAETILFNIIRGCGIDGLLGMGTVNKNIYRPLLIYSKNAIQHYCKLNQINFREDSSNSSTKYSRNHIRHQILPQLEKINHNAVEHIASLSEKSKFYQYAINKLLTTYNNNYKKFHNNGTEIIYDFSEENDVPFLTDYLFHELSKFGFNYHQIVKLCRQFPFKSGNIATSQSHQITTQSNQIYLNEIKNEQAQPIPIHQFPFSFITPEYSININILNYDPNIVLNDKEQLLLGITNVQAMHIIIDFWKVGDKFKPLGMKKGHKKLSDFFTDKKIPTHHRSKIPLIKIQNEIAAIIPYTISENFKINSQTQKVLSIYYKKNNGIL